MLRRPGEIPSSLQHEAKGNITGTEFPRDLHDKKCKNSKKIKDFTRQSFNNLYYHKAQVERSSDLYLLATLQQLIKRLGLDQCCCFFCQDDSLEKTELESILEGAKPELPAEAIEVLDVIEKCLKKGENIDYTDSLKRLLRILSPETMKEYEDQGIEFALNHNVVRPIAKENNETGKWELNLPTEYEYPVEGMILRCFDEVLRIEETEYEKAIAQSSSSRTEIEEDIASSPMGRRVIIAARAFQANMKLGEKGWSIEGYELAKKYYKDYEDGIREKFEEGSIDKDTPREELWKMANEYATSKLLKTIEEPPEGVPKVFFPLHPGSYFEEFNEKERRKTRLGKADRKYLTRPPVELGSPNFNELMEKLSQKIDGTLLNVVITLDKKIMVLPAFFPGGEESQHSIVAEGNPCAWTGEVIIEGKRVTKINDQSGHFKTFDYDDEIQKQISDFALQTFREQGYDVPSKIELTRKRPVSR